MYDVATPSPFRLFSFLDFTCLFYTCLVPCATCPLAPLSELLPLAVALWGSFACPFVVLPPSWSPFVSRAFLALCLVFVSVSWLLLCLAPLFRLSLFVFLPVVLRLSSLRPLCASSVVAGFPVLLFLLCCEVAPPPAGCCLPPPIGCSLAASWSSFCAGPSLWVSGCFMRRPGCLALMPGVLWCFASSLHFASWQQRPLALCGVCVTLYTMVHLLLWSSVLLHWGIHLRMIQDPLWTPLSYTLATHCCMCDILCSCPLLPSRRPLSLFFVWLCLCDCGFLRCPSLCAISSSLT